MMSREALFAAFAFNFYTYALNSLVINFYTSNLGASSLQVGTFNLSISIVQPFTSFVKYLPQSEHVAPALSVSAYEEPEHELEEPELVHVFEQEVEHDELVGYEHEDEVE